MASDFVYHPEAGKEVDDAFHYYQDASPKALRAFYTELQHRRDRLRTYPLSGHPCHSRYRRYNLKGFPYALIYRLKGGFIYLLAFIHEKRQPLYWLRRIKTTLIDSSPCFA